MRPFQDVGVAAPEPRQWRESSGSISSATSSHTSSSSSGRDAGGVVTPLARPAQPADAGVRGLGQESPERIPRCRRSMLEIDEFSKLILFGKGQNKRDAIVVCTRPCHDECRLTRAILESKGRGRAFRPGQGRPLGFVMAWCRAPCDCSKDYNFPRRFAASSGDREEGRGELLEQRGVLCCGAPLEGG